MSKKNSSLEKRLERARIVVNNAIGDAAIKEALSRYNYSEEDLKEGLELYRIVDELYYRQKELNVEKLEATYKMKNKLAELKQKYREHLQLARMALSDDSSAVQSLALSGIRKRSIAGWVEEVRQFYTNALSEPKVIAALSKYAVTKESLSQGKALLAEVDKAAAEQEKKKGIAQKATEARNKALYNVERWLGDLLKIAKLALGKNSQHLEKLGVVVP